jgi:DNA-binding transcriptional regulator of glucitol operon
VNEPRERKVWSQKTERRVTWAVVLVVGGLIAFLVLAWWNLRG